MTKNRVAAVAPRALLAALLVPASVLAQEKQTVPPGTPVTITVQTAAAGPTVTILPCTRKAAVTPIREGCTHTGGGNIDVSQPTPDVLVVTMTGVAVAYCGCKCAHAAQEFVLTQEFSVKFENTKVKKAKLSMEGRLIGMLRSHCKGGAADVGNAHASLTCAPGLPPLSIQLPDHSVAGGENLSVNDHEGPVCIPIGCGKFILHQTFHVSASAPKCLLPCKAPSSEFAPDPALDPLWISAKEPFRGAVKKDFGFQIIIKVTDTTDENGAEEEKKAEEKKEEEKKIEQK